MAAVAITASVALVALIVLLTTSTNRSANHTADVGDVPGGGLARWQVIQVDPNAPYLPTLANQDLAVGPVRLSFTVRDARGVTRGDLRVRIAVYDIDQDPNSPVREQYAQFISYAEESPLPTTHQHATGSSLSDQAQYIGAGVYVVPAVFTHPGTWGLEFQINEDGANDAPAFVLFRMDVRTRSDAPAVGDLAPPTTSRTLVDEPDIRRLTSDPRPEPGLYQLSIDEALDRRRPLVVVFSTPAYCHSRTCGPSLDTVKSVWRDFAVQIDAIHVEVFENPEDPDALREATAFVDWNLPSEPWVFVIDSSGRITARFEGTVTESELRGEVRAVVGG